MPSTTTNFTNKISELSSRATTWIANKLSQAWTWAKTLTWQDVLIFLFKGVGWVCLVAAQGMLALLGLAEIAFFNRPIFWILGFILGGLIEGQVYWKNIFSGLRNIFKDQSLLSKRQFIKNLLDEVLTDFQETSEELARLQAQMIVVNQRKKTEGEQLANDKAFQQRVAELQACIVATTQLQAEQLQRLTDCLGNNAFRNYIEMREKFFDDINADQSKDEANKAKLNALLDTFYTRLKLNEHAHKNRTDPIASNDVERDVDGLITLLGGNNPADFVATAITKIKRLIWLNRSSIAIGFLAGLSMTWASMTLTQQAVLLIGLPSLFTGPAVLPVMAALGGFMYGVMIYKTFNNLFISDTYAEFKHTLSIVFKRSAIETGWSYAGRCIRNTSILLALLGITVIATLATVITWWQLARSGLGIFTKLLHVPNQLAPTLDIINQTAVVIQATGDTTFNAIQTGETWQMYSGFQISESFKTFGHYLVNKFIKWKLNEIETWIQLLNPFRFLHRLSKLLEISIFLGHTFSVGAGGNEYKGLSAGVINGASGGLEITSDVPSLFPDKNAESHQPAPIIETDSPANIAAKKRAAEFTQKREKAFSKLEHTEELIAHFVYLVLVPARFLAFLWDVALYSLAHSIRNKKPQWIAKEKRQEIWKDYYFRSAEEPEPPATAAAITTTEPAAAPPMIIIAGVTEDMISTDDNQIHTAPAEPPVLSVDAAEAVETAHNDNDNYRQYASAELTHQKVINVLSRQAARLKDEHTELSTDKATVCDEMITALNTRTSGASVPDLVAKEQLRKLEKHRNHWNPLILFGLRGTESARETRKVCKEAQRALRLG